MPARSIRTPRMELIACTASLLKAEANDSESLSMLLGAEVSPSMGWPPDIWGDALEEFLERLERYPELSGWLSWYWVLDDGGKRVLAGCGGFTGAPFNGEVMIGYSLVEPYRRLGYGSEAVSALVNWAFAHRQIQRVIAETFPDNFASIRLLEKCGFEYAGRGFEKGTIRYLFPRDKWFLSNK